MPANTTFTAGAVLTAQQMNNLPWGIVDATAGGTSGRGFVNKTSGDTTITSATSADLSGITITFNAVAGRLYKADFYCVVSTITSAAQPVVELTDGSNNQLQWTVMNIVANGYSFSRLTRIFSGLTGSQTMKIRVRTTAGVSTVFGGDAIFPTVFSIEDIGPAS